MRMCISPYEDVKVKGVAMKALMDSGANVSAMGQGMEKFLKQTVSGSLEEGIGYVTGIGAWKKFKM